MDWCGWMECKGVGSCYIVGIGCGGIGDVHSWLEGLNVKLMMTGLVPE